MEPVEIDTSVLEWPEQKRVAFAADLISRVTAGETLARSEIRQFMVLVLNRGLGEATETTFGALSAAMMARDDPTVPEVLGMLDVVLWHDRESHYVPDCDGTVGIVGSGKDDLKTFNVSTGASLVAAACGVPTIKNGSRSESGVSGTTDMMELFGTNISPSEADLTNSLDVSNMAFIDAGSVFPRMMDMYVGRFLFINPLSYVLSVASGADFDRITFGLANRDVEFTASVLNQLRFEPSLVVNGAGPHDERLIDEFSVVGPSRVAYIEDDGIRTETMTPADVGLPRHDPETIAQQPTHDGNARRLLKAIEPPYAKRGHPPTDMVALNAAAALYVGGNADSIATALPQAFDAITDGRALETLYRVVEHTGGDPNQLDELRDRVLGGHDE